MTVMLLAHEKVSERAGIFRGRIISGVLLPAGEGSVAVLTRERPELPDAVATQVLSGVRW